MGEVVNIPAGTTVRHRDCGKDQLCFDGWSTWLCSGCKATWKKERIEAFTEAEFQDRFEFVVVARDENVHKLVWVRASNGNLHLEAVRPGWREDPLFGVIEPFKI